MKEHDWDTLHKWEIKEKTRFLKNLTIEEGFRIFQDLHQLAQTTINKKGMLKINSENIKTLSKIHFAFGKVKVGKAR